MISLNEGIAVDAAHSTKNRKTEFQGVDLKNGKTLFYCDLGNQTINIGEFLAIVEAVKYIIEHDFHPKVIFPIARQQSVGSKTNVPLQANAMIN